MSRGKGMNKRAKQLKFDGPGKNCGQRAKGKHPKNGRRKRK